MEKLVNEDENCLNEQHQIRELVKPSISEYKILLIVTLLFIVEGMQLGFYSYYLPIILS